MNLFLLSIVWKRIFAKRKSPDGLSVFMAGEVGVEPTLAVLETDVLPLYYSPMCALLFYLNRSYFARDFIVRLGGDEFLVIFKDCKIETVKNRMTAVQNEVFRNNSLPCNLTLSIGISTYKEENTINDTIKEADTALYESKAYRNNTIVEYKPKELKLGIEKA